MTRHQFLRVETYNRGSSQGIISEANRDPGFTAHIDAPGIARWRIGSAEIVRERMTSYMQKPAQVKAKSGRLLERVKRVDHRCLVSGVMSWPDTVSESLSKEYQKREDFKKWHDDSIRWLESKYRESLFGVCLHMDESHPHLHFFVVGDANRLHPGLRCEFVNDIRIVDSGARFKAYKLGLRNWLRDYHTSVGQACGLHFVERLNPAPRIADRALWIRIAAIDKILAESPNTEAQILRDELVNSLRVKGLNE